MSLSWTNWQWLQQQGVLQIQLADDVLFATPYITSSVIDHANEVTTEQAQLYIQCREQLCQTQYDEQSQFSIAVYLMAAAFKIKPMAAKSWLFKPATNQSVDLTTLQIVELESEKLGQYMVVNYDSNTATLMLLEQEHQLDSVRTIKQGELVKVHRDRINHHVVTTDEIHYQYRA